MMEDQQQAQSASVSRPDDAQSDTRSQSMPASPRSVDYEKE
jgi:hypothetical protein